MDGKLVIPFTIRNAIMKTLHEAKAGQFGRKCQFFAFFIYKFFVL